MTTSPPNLTKIDFSDIKTSLTEYLKNQNIFVGYNFEGSAIQTIIDLLAYNTYYYAFYSNLLSSEVFLDSAQRTKSIVSLVKPLGYTIPGLKSAQARVNISSNCSEFTSFTGFLNNGSIFSFYNTQNGVTTSPLILTEGTLVSKIISSEIDLTKQKYIIPDSNVDISTIMIKVTRNSTTNTWKNINYFPNDNDTIFYIERNGNLFEVHFGKENNLGSSIVSDDIVEIKYLKSSGSAGNGVFNFTSSGLTVTTLDQSFGGNDEPDLDVVKFIAPRVFSGQDRAVTKGDYSALLIRDDHFSDTDSFTVYGGNELDPPKPGRVFVSYELGSGNPDNDIIIEYLRKKNPLALIPEYVIPKKYDITIHCNISYRLSVDNSRKNVIVGEIKNLFETLYSNFNSYRFSRKFNFSEIKELVFDNFESEVSSFDYVKTVITTSSPTQKFSEFYLENKLTENGFNIMGVTINNSQYQIRLPQTTETKIQSLELFNTSNQKQTLDVGRVLMSSGYIRLNKLWNSSDNSITITNKSSVIAPIEKSLVKFNNLDITTT
jgi:hypothetical protein